MGKLNAALMEAKETNFEKRKTRMKIPRHTKVGQGFIPNKIPKDVATPLPPLNPTNTGKI